MASFFLECLQFVAFAITKFYWSMIYMVLRNRPRKEIKNSHILITGSAQGLGKIIATRLAKDGNTLHLVDINDELNKKNMHHLKSHDCKIFTYVCDVGNITSILALHDAVKANCNHLDYLFNNAGVLLGKLYNEMSLSEIDFVMNINTMGIMRLTKVFLNDMIENGGHLVNTCSVAGTVGGPFMTTYCASKHAVAGFAKTLLLDLEYQGFTNVKITTVFPHFVDTGLCNGATVKLPKLFPLLDPQWVVSEMLIAVREERNELVLPRVTTSVIVAQYILDSEVFRAFCRLLGNDLMKTFRLARNHKIRDNDK